MTLNTTLSSCHNFLFNELLVNWSKFGIDKAQGFSYESLNHDWTPNKVGRVRLLTQCRQLYTFSRASLLTQNSGNNGNVEWQAKLGPLFNFILANYFKDQRWIFSLDDDLKIKDSQSDTYALAFVLLSFSHYFKATGDKRALDYMKLTHLFLQDQLSAESGGFYEAYPVDLTQNRRQNPHMHLLEGYIAAYQTTLDDSYKQVIQSLLALTLTRFYDQESQTLREFFSPDWQIHPEVGHKIEPGHHFEWVWLLYQANTIAPNADYIALAQHLWTTATRHGLADSGGIYNQIDGNSYQVIDKEKRIWPITEYLKAITVIPIGIEEKQYRLENALRFMQTHYILDDGRWHEYLDEHNKVKNFPLPGTSSYHIFLGLSEAMTWAQINMGFAP